ncbi:hypothetical protein D3Z45_14745 [Lachnospiraceae bacterium]|nr:hypothetical protein [Lachnospiraceae bacterium]
MVIKGIMVKVCRSSEPGLAFEYFNASGLPRLHKSTYNAQKPVQRKLFAQAFLHLLKPFLYDRKFRRQTDMN